MQVGYSFGSCDAPTLGRYVFYVFDTRNELDAYLEQKQCESDF